MTVGSPYRATGQAGTGKQIAQQIIKWKPDLVWCHHGRAASCREFIDALHKACLKTAVYLCDEPYETGETASYSPLFRYVFSMDFKTVESHKGSRQDRSSVFYLPPGVDSDLFAYRSYRERNATVLFLGNATLPPREAWLRPIEKLVVGSDIRFWQSTGKRDPRWVPQKDHPALYASCRVGLNVHRHPGITAECYKKRVVGRRSSKPVPKGIKLCQRKPEVEGTGFWNDGDLPASHVNPRFFEMAACGTLVVSDDHRSELARMFPMAPRAESPEHFLELVLYYMGHEDEAEEIGKVCSIQISRRHSYRHRAAEVLIRAGLRESEQAAQLFCLGPLEDWLTPQDFSLLEARSSSAATGLSGRWSPPYGMSLTRMSGSVSVNTSIDVQTPWPS